MRHTAHRWRAVLLLWIASVVLLSLLPLRFKNMLGTTGLLHASGHFLVFLVTMLLAGWNANVRLQQTLIGIPVILFGIGLEISEVLIYHNRFEWQDVVVDACGVLTGLLLLLALRTKQPAQTARQD